MPERGRGGRTHLRIKLIVAQDSQSRRCQGLGHSHASLMCGRRASRGGKLRCVIASVGPNGDSLGDVSDGGRRDRFPKENGNLQKPGCNEGRSGEKTFFSDGNLRQLVHVQYVTFPCAREWYEDFHQQGQ
jgi:hypothetical protein